MRHIYTILFYLCLPFILLRLLWRGRRIKAHRQRWRERFALKRIPTHYQHGIWLHAVSLGEVIAAAPLIKALLKQYPNLPLTVTTMTVTGSKRAQETFHGDVFHCYLPYDLPLLSKRFLNQLKPKLFIIMETELWPNLLNQCTRTNIPVFLANARLSEKSAKGYQRIPSLTKAMLLQINHLAAQSQADAERFIALGLPAERVTVAGSIKFDINIAASIMEQGALLREQWGTHRTVWIAASTHDGEEDIILQALTPCLKAIKDLLLVLVPRHPERFAKIKQLCQKSGFSVVTRSSHAPVQTDTQIFLGDTVGELSAFYHAADIAFVGGSLVPVGGHNVLEAAACGLPVLSGPHYFNAIETNELLAKAGVLSFVHNDKELAKAVIDLLNAPSQCAEIGDKAKRVVADNRGALAKHLHIIAEQLGQVAL